MIAAIENFLRGLSDRSKYGLVFLGALLGFDVVSRIDEAAEAQRAERQVALDLFAGADRGISLESWRGRSAEAAAAVDQWRGRVWSGQTPGVIAAEIQTRITAHARPLDIPSVKVEVDPKPIEIAGGEALRFQLTASVDASAKFAHFFQALEKSNPVLFVDELALTVGRQDQAYFEIGGFAPISYGAPPDPQTTASLEGEGP